MSPFGRLLEPIKSRVALMLGRAVLRLVSDAAGLQRLQVTLLSGEVRSDIERFQQYGFSSTPLAGAEAVVLFLGGNRDHPIVLSVDDRRYRPKDARPGETILYTHEDQQDGGHRIHLKQNQEIEIRAGKKITLTCGQSSIVLQPDNIRLTTPDYEANQS